MVGSPCRKGQAGTFLLQLRAQRVTGDLSYTRGLPTLRSSAMVLPISRACRFRRGSEAPLVDLDCQINDLVTGRECSHGLRAASE